MPRRFMSANFAAARRRFCSSRSGPTPSKSRNGWYRSSDSPSSSARARIASGESGEATRSGSKISTPSNPASRAATSFSSSVPLRQTVAIDVRMAPSCGHRRWCPRNSQNSIA